MKQTTNQFLAITAAAILIGTAGNAIAHGGYGPGWGGPGGMMGGPGGMGPPGMIGGPGGMPGIARGPGAMKGTDPVAYTDQRLAQAKAELGITPEQEAAWTRYADAAKAKAELMAAHRQAMFGGETVTPEQRQAFHQEGQAQRQQVATATRELYAVLTPQQQASAGALLGRCRLTR
jgi:hypothetical protein